MEKFRINFIIRKNKKGFTLVFFAVLMLVLSSVLLGSGTALFALKKKNQFQKECEQLALGAQVHVQRKLSQLMALNAPAKALSARHTTLQLRLALAVARGDAPQILFTKAQLVALNRQRLALEKTQNFIIQSAEDAQSKWARLSKSNLQSERTRHYPKLPVEPFGGRPAPQYRLADSFRSEAVSAAQGTLRVNFIKRLNIKWGCESRFRVLPDRAVAILAEAI